MKRSPTSGRGARWFRTPRACLTGLAVALVLILAGRTAMAGPLDSRLVRMFDFEEAAQGNFEDMPMSWYRIGTPPRHGDAAFSKLPLHDHLIAAKGYPNYTDVRFDHPQQEQGNHCPYLGLDGSNAGAFLEVGAIPAVPSSNYRVTAQVRTSELTTSHAVVFAYFVDGYGKLIESSMTQTPPLRTGGQWESVSLNLTGEYGNAAWIGVQVELRQQTSDPASLLGEHQIVLTQIRGEAWFDNVGIWQLPSIAIRTSSPVNVIRHPQKPKLTMEVRDLTGRPLDAEVTVYDHRLAPVATLKQALGDGASPVWNWTPTLPRFGWYLVDMIVHDHGDAIDAGAAKPPGQAIAVARTLAAMLWLPDIKAKSVSDLTRFGILAEGLPDEELNLTPMMMGALNLTNLTVSAWSDETTDTTIDQRLATLDQVIESMLGHGGRVALSFSPLPRQMAKRMDLDDRSPFELSETARNYWEPMLKPVLLREGQRVQSWWLTQVPNAASAYEPELTPRLADIRHQLQRLAPQPRMVLPWRLDQQENADSRGADSMVLHVSQAVRPEMFGEYLAPWRKLFPDRSDSPDSSVGGDAGLLAHLELPPATELAHPRRIDDLAIRMLCAWEASFDGLYLTLPWTVSTQPQLRLHPDPLLGVYAQIAHLMAGRKVVGRFNLARGIPCLILDGAEGGLLAAWNQQAQDDNTLVNLYLGPNPQVMDVWGNISTPPLVNGRHQLTLSSTPCFIDGADIELATFRSSFTMNDPFIESRQTVHPRVLILRNPWPRTVSGHLMVVEPEKWHISPQRVFFSIAAGQEYEIPVELSFPASEVAGEKELVAELEFSSVRRYNVRFTTPMELGLKDIRFDANLSVEGKDADTEDVIVTQLVTNHGMSPVSLYAFANLQGFPRQERIISNLKAGQSILRRFRFPNAKAQALQQPIRAGLREVNGPAVLNHVLYLQ
ncbi:MAG: hypothetical protein IT440_10830 [Phycisphaeraceae bacterium]|nr:hypothetical protein [Phycisphaeraceae bacterium]